MRPVAFGGCFGWLHPASGAVGVVICPGLGHDARVAHRSLRRLADRIAEAGYPTLRFDYPGTGDSADVGTNDHLAAWLASVRAAVDHLRSVAGVDRVVLCGLRFGAALAALAARERSDVAGLMLLAPVISGRLYARELTISERLSLGEGGEPDQGWLEVDGLRLPLATLRAIQAVDLREATTWPVRHTLLLATTGATQADDLVTTIVSLGAVPVAEVFEGYAAFLAGTSVDTVTPHAAFERAVAWLRSTIPPGVGSGRPTPAESSARLEASDWTEEVLRFGAGIRLSGVLCRPAGLAAGGDDWVLVLGNSGGDPRYGYGRFQVELARRLAQAGLGSLRFDFAGLGDSADGPADPHPYATDRGADLAAAADHLRGLGFGRIALGGLCSGAYHALQAARHDPRVEALLLFNLVYFAWGERSALPAPGEHHGRSLGGYVARLRRAETWHKLARGEVRAGTAARAVRRLLVERGAHLWSRIVEAFGRQTQRGEAHRVMRHLSDRGMPVLMCLGTQERELEIVEAHFGKGGRQLAAMPGIRVRLLAGIDHNLSRARMREAAIEAVLTHLEQEEIAPAATRRSSATAEARVETTLAPDRQEQSVHGH